MQQKVVNDKIIFISWTNYSSHSKLLAQASGATIYYVNDIMKTRNTLRQLFIWLDYLLKSIRTLYILWKSKPKFVFVQNPPSIAPILIILFRKCGSYKVLIDSHNGAFEGKCYHSPFHRWAVRQADVVTVHNKQLFERLLNDLSFKEINFKVLSSRLTDFSKTKKEPQEQPYFLVVNTFSVDEPTEILLEGILEFCKGSNSSLKFKVTGSYQKHYSLFSKFSKCENIEFVGFVDEQKYDYYLVNSIGVISLSTRDDVQQFAVSEAISAEIPFISNSNSTNLDLFGDKMVLTELLPSSISLSIETFIRNREKLNKIILEIKKAISYKWDRNFIQIKNELGL